MKAIMNYRYYVLLLLCGIAIIGVFSCPDDNTQFSTWLAAMLVSKSIGIGAGYAYYKLFTLWDEQGKISEIKDLFKEEEL